jgi:hypothetical protein
MRIRVRVEGLIYRGQVGIEHRTLKITAKLLLYKYHQIQISNYLQRDIVPSLKFHPFYHGEFPKFKSSCS